MFQITRVLRSIMAVVLIFLLLVSVLRCDANSDPPDREIEQLKSKVASLESRYIDLEKEIIEKDEKLSLLEKNSELECTQATSLANEIEVLQNRSASSNETVQKANTHNDFLEKQVEMLQIQLEKKVRKREALEEKVGKAEQTARQLRRRLEYAEKIKQRQRAKYQQLERHLEIAQTELGEVQTRVNVIAGELEKVRAAWIPHWLTGHVLRFQEILFRNWNKLVRSASGEFVPKAAYSKISDVYGICMEAITPSFIKVKQTLRPYFQAAYSKTGCVYKICMDVVIPRVIGVGRIMQPYLQRVKKLFEPYFAGARAETEPWATKVPLLHEPHRKKDTVSTFQKVIDLVVMYHHQAAAFLCMLLITLFVVGSSIFWRRYRGTRSASYKPSRGCVEKK